MLPAEFVTGDLPELEAALAGAVREARRDDPLAPVTVLVGHVLLKRYLPRMLAQQGIAHINVHFVSPHQLASDLAPREVALRTRITPAANRLLVRRVAEAADGAYFGKITRGEGFVDALGRLFRELELGGYGDADALEQALVASQPDGNHAKLRELSQMYRAYLAERAAAGLAGIGDAYATADVTRLAGEVLVYGLWDPPELQVRFLERIAEIKRLRVLTAHRPGDDAPESVLLARLGGSENALERATTGPIADAAARLFRATDVQPPIDSARIALVSAPDTVREVWEAARACLRWADDGIAFHEMAVVYRNRDPYRALVQEIFADAQIDAYMHDGRPLAEHPLGRRLLALIDLAGAHEAFSRQQVMEFLTETQLPYATRTNERYGRVNASQWDALTRDAGVVGGIDQWRSRLARVAAERREDAKVDGYAWLAEAAVRIDGLLAFVDDFHGALASRPDVASWDEHLAYLTNLAGTYADGVKPLLEALADLRGLAAVAPAVSFEAFCRAVRDDLETRDASRALGEPVRLFGRSGVAVVDATSLRHLRFRAVYMLGAAERAWPPPPRPDPLLLEHERARLNGRRLNGRRLNEMGAGVMPLRTSPDRDSLTFWLGMQAATEHVAVSFARAEAGSTGKHVPSYFFRAVAEALTGTPLSTAALDASGVVRRIGAGQLSCADIDAAVTAAEYDRGLVREAIDGTRPAATAALSEESPSFRRAIVARQHRWGMAFSPYDGVMMSEAAIAQAAAIQFGRERAVSPSRLEMYAECPYRYFMHYALGIEPIDEPEAVDRINALERGSMIHRILERFLTLIGREDPPRTDARERHLAQLLRVAEEEGAERESRGVTGRPLLWQIDQRSIHHDLIRWYDEEVRMAAASPLRPGAFEAGFGGARAGFGDRESDLSTDEPLVLRAGDREIRLQGRIDRIDWDDARTRFRVIDYKTGTKHDESAFKGGRALQLPVYLHAAASMLDMDPSDGEAQYFYVSTKGKFSRVALEGETLEGRRAEFDQVLQTIAGGVDAGYFAPNPEKDRCRWCDYKDVCDKDIDRVMSRKSGDARATAFIEMTEIP